MKRYTLLDDTYGTLLGPDGRATAEGWLDKGQVFRAPVSDRISGADTSPLDGRRLCNRPTGRLFYDEAGAAWVLPEDAHLEETK